MQRAVATLREEHRACDQDLLRCPWPVMWDEDVTALYGALTTLGFEIRPRDGRELVMAEHVEYMDATSPIGVILPGEEYPDGSVASPRDYALVISGGGVTVVVGGEPQDFAVFSQAMAGALGQLHATAWRAANAGA